MNKNLSGNKNHIDATFIGPPINPYKMDRSLSPNITLADATYSDTAIRKGIKNEPNTKQIGNLIQIAINIGEPLIERFLGKVLFTSFFRSKVLNAAIYKPKLSLMQLLRIIKYRISDHCALGDVSALDVDGDFHGSFSNRIIFEYVRDHLEYDKLIWEFGDDENPAWIHISLRAGVNRKINLRAIRTKKGIKYLRL